MPTLFSACTMVVKWSPDLLNVHPQRKGTAAASRCLVCVLYKGMPTKRGLFALLIGLLFKTLKIFLL